MSGLTSRSHAHHYGPGRHADHFVYRCYDADGVLLYIGCTRNVKSRIAAHRRGNGGSKASQWLSVTMASYEVEGPFRGREAGRLAERDAIQAEWPVFNYQETASLDRAAWMTRSGVARYLVEHGHAELALATACTCWRETREAGQTDSWCEAHVSQSEAATQRGAA